MGTVLDTPLGKEFRKLCDLKVILEETQGYVEALIKSGKDALAEAEVTEWVTIGRTILTA